MKLRQGNVFTPVCHSVHRGGVCYPLGRHPIWAGTLPWADTPWADTPLGRHPLPSACWATHPLPSACWDTHLSCTVHAWIWSTSGRYASYWNTYLLKLYSLSKDTPQELQTFSKMTHSSPHVIFSNYSNILPAKNSPTTMKKQSPYVFNCLS